MLNEEEEVEDIDVEEEDEDVDLTDWKAEAEKAKAEAEKYKAIATRYKKKSSKTAEPEEKESKKSNSLDYGQKAYLKASGISGKEEMELVQHWVESTGKELDDILESKHFKNELSDLRDDKEVKAAMPDGTKRSGNQGRDTVDYWIAKGEMPPADSPKLRQEYVNAKMKRTSGNENPFYNAKR